MEKQANEVNFWRMEAATGKNLEEGMKKQWEKQLSMKVLLKDDQLRTAILHAAEGWTIRKERWHGVSCMAVSSTTDFMFRSLGDASFLPHGVLWVNTATHATPVPIPYHFWALWADVPG